MSDYIDDDELDRHGPLVRDAVNQLIANHRDEYDELTGRWAKERTEELERQMRYAREELAKVRALNPDGANVPALTDTANNLVKANDELAAAVAKLQAENDKLKGIKQRLQDSLKEAMKHGD